MPPYTPAADHWYVSTNGSLFQHVPPKPSPRLAVAPAAPPGTPPAPPPASPPPAPSQRSQRERLREILNRLTLSDRLVDSLADLIAAASGPPTADGSVSPVAWSAMVELAAALAGLQEAADGVREALGPEEAGRGNGAPGIH